MTNGINVEQKYFLMNIQHANGVGREKNNVKGKPKVSKMQFVIFCFFSLPLIRRSPKKDI